ncbi:MAG: transglycosylase SLT domain-containing protein, partial [Gammaproteobacteria bacterium]
PEDLRADGRVEKQLEKLIEGIHGYELVALKEGDGFTERRPVPAPVDEIAEMTFPSIPDPRLKEKAERQVKDTASDLPLVINDYVLSYINYFSNRGRAGMEASLRRSGPYREMVYRVLKEEGLPQELIYLAQAESAFHPWALSRAGARGMWQFMAARGREYGLNLSWWVDERQDPEKSTRAAARHLKDLHTTFGDWYLAMAAYNSGPGNVQRAIERTGYADFWELLRRNVLPRETRNYVPIILAATIVAKNPEKYGLENIIPDPPVATDTVRIATPTDLRLIAETIDCSVGLLQTLNPSLLRMVTPKSEFDLRLPAGTKERFLEQVALIPEDKRVFWRWHRVGAGESLAEIARKYKTTGAAISEVNGLDTDQPLRAGSKIVIPVTSARDNGDVRTVRLSYRVRRGDTVEKVAARFGVDSSDVRAWNRISGNSLAAGRRLVIKTTRNDTNGAPRTARKSRSKPVLSSKSRHNSKLATSTRASASLSRGGSSQTRA